VQQGTARALTQLAEERGARANVTLVLPLVFLPLPAFYIITPDRCWCR
jgi:hypothetical protein